MIRGFLLNCVCLSLIGFCLFVSVHDCCSCRGAYARDLHSPVHSCASNSRPCRSKALPPAHTVQKQQQCFPNTHRLRETASPASWLHHVLPPSICLSPQTRTPSQAAVAWQHGSALNIFPSSGKIYTFSCSVISLEESMWVCVSVSLSPATCFYWSLPPECLLGEY